MRKTFLADFLESRQIHRPLAIHKEEMREARCEQKPVISSRLLDDMTSLDRFEAVGEYAKIALSTEEQFNGLNSLQLTCPTKLDHWPRAYGRIYSIPAAIALYCMDRLLCNIKKADVFISENTEYLRKISWCAYVASLIFFILGFMRPTGFVIAFAGFFVGLILRVVKNVFAQAVLIREENEFTI